MTHNGYGQCQHCDKFRPLLEVDSRLLFEVDLLSGRTVRLCRPCFKADRKRRDMVAETLRELRRTGR